MNVNNALQILLSEGYILETYNTLIDDTPKDMNDGRFYINVNHLISLLQNADPDALFNVIDNDQEYYFQKIELHDDPDNNFISFEIIVTDNPDLATSDGYYTVADVLTKCRAVHEPRAVVSLLLRNTEDAEETEIFFNHSNCQTVENNNEFSIYITK